MTKQYINKFFFCCILLFSIIGCQEEFDTKEVYKKIVYIINSDDAISPFTHPFTGAESTGFVSVYCSGSLMPENDILVELGYDNELVSKYNFTEFENDTGKYVVPLASKYYKIPSFSATIKKGEPHANVFINVNPEGLSPDTTYVIPLKIISSSEYEISEKLSSILYSVKLENDYSGKYRMVGTLREEGSTDKPQEVFKEKTLVPLNKNTCRMFFSAENELKENIGIRTFKFSVQSDNRIVISEENDVLDMGGSYFETTDKEEKIVLNYSFERSGVRYEMNEKLIRTKIKK